MTNTHLFEYEGHDFRTVDVNGEPWFVAADVCKVLEIINVGNALSRLDEADIRSTDVWSPLNNRAYATKIVNESGLYDLILDSRKPEAKRFRRWITAEVLPTIRKTGGVYADPELDLSDPGVVLDKFEMAVKIAKEARAELAVVKPRAAGAIGSEGKRGGQAVWDLRDAVSEAVGCGAQDVLSAVAALGAIEKRGTSYSVRNDWDDVLFASETKVPNPKGGEPYTYQNGTIRVVPGKQDEFLSRIRKANERRIFGDN